MKTETQIAEENIQKVKSNIPNGFAQGMEIMVSKEHKASCERFLNYLQTKREDMSKLAKGEVVIWDEVKEEDLQQAIKLYKEVGI